MAGCGITVIVNAQKKPARQMEDKMRKQKDMKKKIDLGKITIENFENNLVLIDGEAQREVKGGDGEDGTLNTITPVFCKP